MIAKAIVILLIFLPPIGEVLIGRVSFGAESRLLAGIVPVSDEWFLCGGHRAKVWSMGKHVRAAEGGGSTSVWKTGSLTAEP